MSLITASASAIQFLEDFSATDETQLSKGGRYTTSNYYTYNPGGTIWSYSRIVSNTAQIYAWGNCIESGANRNYNPADTKSISLINNVFIPLGPPVKFRVTSQGDTRTAQYNYCASPEASYTIGIGANPVSPYTGLWVTVAHVRTGISSNSTTPQITNIRVGTTPFGNEVLANQQIIAGSPDNTKYYIDLVITPSSVSYKTWAYSGGVEPEAYSVLTFSPQSSIYNNVFIGQRAYFAFARTSGEWIANATQHYLDDILMRW